MLEPAISDRGPCIKVSGVARRQVSYVRSPLPYIQYLEKFGLKLVRLTMEFIPFLRSFLWE